MGVDIPMNVHWLMTIAATTFTFVILLMLVRWIGETQISQATYFNWVAGACMGNIAANMITAGGWQPLITGAVQLFFFSAVTIAAAYLSLKSRRFRKIATGEPIVLVHRGQYILKHMKRSKIDLDLLQQMLREQGYFDYRKVEYAILEPTGSLSVLPKSDREDKVDVTPSNPEAEQRQQTNHIK
ncbi:hypothetical protein URH17368_2678 [Alicyclobacillus hesperidum URH17-3-68]|nr:hypothetical protein URH17368_2678 [Alicyclobacillus hesperidum URH17-3-68]